MAALVALLLYGSLWVLAEVPRSPSPVQIEFFYTEGCTICYRVSTEILPLLNAQYGGLYALTRYDIDVDTNYLRLAAYQDALAIDEHATSVLIVNGTRTFSDWESIRTTFLDYVGQLISGAIEAPIVAGPAPEAMSLTTLERRLRNFTIAGVALAGLVDGINPCAISTLVFFISMLSVMKVTGRRLMLAGALFCLTSFVTYIAIGMGIFRLLYLFTAFHLLQRGLEWFMIAALLVLGLLSIRDALRFRSSGRAADVTLKLPRRVSERIHALIRSGMSSRHILWASVATAFLVTVLESVCTGQVYLPTLVLLLDSGKSVGLVMSYLLLYNTLFILPLVIALVLAYQGTRTERFVHWSRENVVPSKLALAALFFALAALIAII